MSSLLKKRQFLFELPQRLVKCLEMNAASEAIRYYNGTRYGALSTGALQCGGVTRRRNILDKYKHLPSFNSIYDESERIMNAVRQDLHERVGRSLHENASDMVSLALNCLHRLPVADVVQEFEEHVRIVSDAISLLTELKEPAEQLRTHYISLYGTVRCASLSMLITATDMCCGSDAC